MRLGHGPDLAWSCQSAINTDPALGPVTPHPLPFHTSLVAAGASATFTLSLLELHLRVPGGRVVTASPYGAALLKICLRPFRTGLSHGKLTEALSLVLRAVTHVRQRLSLLLANLTVQPCAGLPRIVSALWPWSKHTAIRGYHQSVVGHDRPRSSPCTQPPRTRSPAARCAGCCVPTTRLWGPGRPAPTPTRPR